MSCLIQIKTKISFAWVNLTQLLFHFFTFKIYRSEISIYIYFLKIDIGTFKFIIKSPKRLPKSSQSTSSFVGINNLARNSLSEESQSLKLLEA